MNPLIEQMKQHRSVRQYDSTPPKQEDIGCAIEAGQAASTSSAIQAYSVIHVRDTAHKNRLVELTGGQSYVGKCGAFFAICGDVRRLQLACEKHGGQMNAKLEGFLLAVIDASLFAQNMALALESMGYGICFIGGLRNNLPEVDKLLKLPSGVYPLYGLCVGVSEQAPTPRPRLDASAVFFDDAYPSDQAMLKMIEEYDERYEKYLRQRGANPKGWSKVMAGKFAEPFRPELAAYYLSKGADLS